MHPGAQPGSAFARMQQQRQYGIPTQQTANSPPSPTLGRQSPEFSRKPVSSSPLQAPHSPELSRRPLPAAAQAVSSPPTRAPVPRDETPSPEMHPGMGPPIQMPPHSWDHNRNIPAAAMAGSGTVVGMAAGAAMAGSPPHNQEYLGPYDQQNQNAYDPSASNPYGPSMGYGGPQGPHLSYSSHSSQEPLATAPAPFGTGALQPGNYYSDYHPASRRYSDMPGEHNLDNMVFVDPNNVADDGDDGLFVPAEDPRRISRLSFGRHSKGSNTAVNAIPLAATGVAGAATAVAAPAVGSLFNRDPSGTYSSVPGGSGGLGGNGGLEKSAWLQNEELGRKKRLKWIFVVLGVIVILGIVGGVVGGVLASRKGSSSASSTSSSSADESQNGDLNIHSSDIQKLLNNPNLHKVFPGIDYTPLNAQYPACLTVPPDQNNITRDVAVMSQLTSAIRLYGTDCNQTQMVLHAITQLQFQPSEMQVWLGVWLENNQTTNDRQMAQMYDILDQYGTKYIKGAIIGNEVLFRQDMTAAQLEEVLTGTKANFTQKNIDLPVATSDLGSSWTVGLVEAVDIVMANVHPFFGGVPADQAAGWTWNFWQENDVVLTQGMTNKTNVIAETGWPSQGGNDCGTSTTCTTSTAGSVAGIDEMNTFLSGWVCTALSNGTEYFWYACI